MTGASRPLTATEFDSLMQGCGSFPEPPRFAVACSGGPDSIALAFLLQDWVSPRGGTLHAITIDHQLRAESGVEASQVKQWCAEKSISHTTLVWKKDSALHSAIHQQARKARYELLRHACAKHNIDVLFLGHHADDQAETVLMRFLKGSGIDGLAGMPRTRLTNGLTLVRPLLPVPKLWLEHTCEARGWNFVRDPSNDSPAYLRGRLRKLAAPLAHEGLSTATLFDTARSAGMARSTLEILTNDWLRRHAIIHPMGMVQCDRNAWKNLDADMQHRTLTRILLCMSGADYPPKTASLDVLTHSLRDKETLHHTLCGCHIIAQSGSIKFYRELAAVAPRQCAHPDMLWDNRFKLVIDASLLNKKLDIAPLGDISRDALEKMGAKQVADCAALHRASLPALYSDNQLHSIPEFVPDEASAHTSQAPVKAIFLPKRMLLVRGFDVCPPLLT
jgi:tRNA(Ile)-lysidine synthase